MVATTSGLCVSFATQKGYFAFGQHTLEAQLHFSTSNFCSNAVHGSIVLVSVIVRREGRRGRGHWDAAVVPPFKHMVLFLPVAPAVLWAHSQLTWGAILIPLFAFLSQGLHHYSVSEIKSWGRKKFKGLTGGCRHNGCGLKSWGAVRETNTNGIQPLYKALWGLFHWWGSDAKSEARVGTHWCAGSADNIREPENSWASSLYKWRLVACWPELHPPLHYSLFCFLSLQLKISV